MLVVFIASQTFVGFIQLSPHCRFFQPQNLFASRSHLQIPFAWTLSATASLQSGFFRVETVEIVVFITDLVGLLCQHLYYAILRFLLKKGT